MIVEQLFSSPVYNSSIDIDLKPYLDLCLKEEDHFKIDYLGKEVNKVSGASKELYILEKEEFKDLKNEILKHTKSYTNDILKYSNDFKITTSWISFTDPGCSSLLHRHQNSIFSGIVYLQTDEKSGNLMFENYHNLGDFSLNRKEHNILNSELWHYTPFNNKIILFPAKLFHKIDTNNSNIKRVSVAFNLIPYGTFGQGDSTLTIPEVVKHEK